MSKVTIWYQNWGFSTELGKQELGEISVQLGQCDKGIEATEGRISMLEEYSAVFLRHKLTQLIKELEGCRVGGGIINCHMLAGFLDTEILFPGTKED